MRTPRLAVSALLAIVMMAFGLAAAPVGATSGSLSFKWTYNPKGNAGLLSVYIYSLTPITSMTVHIMSGNADMLDLPLSDFALSPTSSTTGSQQWTVKTAITTSQLPLGAYTVTGDATDSGGETVTGQYAGTFDFFVDPSLTLSPLRVPISANGQVTAFSGQLTGLYPDGSTQAMGGQQVVFTDGTTQWPLTTAPDGTFQVTVPVSLGTSYVAEFPATVTAWSAQSAYATPEAVQAPVNLTASITPSPVVYGQQAVLNGTLTSQQNGSWLPLSGQTVSVFAGGATLTATTDTSGDFSVNLPTVASTTVWHVSFNFGTTQDPFLQSTEITTTETVVLPLAVTNFAASLTKFGDVNVNGCLVNTAPGAPDITGNPAIQIEYSTSASGPWTALGQVATSPSAACSTASDPGVAFSGTLPAVLAYAYYRAGFAGATDYPPAVSDAALAWRYPTRFSRFSASPHRVRKRKKITVSGTLQSLGQSWAGFAHRPVLIIFQPRGQRLWYAMFKVWTNAHGSFGKRFADRYGTGRWSADYMGDKTHLVAGAPVVRVKVG